MFIVTVYVYMYVNSPLFTPVYSSHVKVSGNQIPSPYYGPSGISQKKKTNFSRFLGLISRCLYCFVLTFRWNCRLCFVGCLFKVFVNRRFPGIVENDIAHGAKQNAMVFM